MLDKQYPVVHSNGLNKDKLFQDSNDVTFVLNGIRDNHEGGRTEYQSEPGNQISASLPDGYFIVGSIYLQNDEIAILSTDEINSEIGIYKHDTYTTLVNIDCLGFNLEHPITGEYRVRNGCERTIYWCDHFNSDYWYNIDDPDSFKTGGVFDCNKFKLNPTILPIKVDLTSVNDFGGILPLGSYYFQPEVLDENENTIYRGDITPQVIIYDESQNDNYSTINGGLNIEQYDPTIGGVPITNKSISLKFYNLNTSFSFLRINVFRSINGNQVIDGHAVASLIPISGTSVDWTYQGYNTSAGDFPIDVSEKLVDHITYESAYVMEQVQNRLVRANLKQTTRDYSSYQSFASKITGKWVAEELETFNATVLGNSKNPHTYWLKRSCQGDEVYLPGIQFIHNNGEISPVFPLIGRAADSTDLELLTVIPNNSALGATDVWLSDVEHLGLDINDQVERWKVFNTATITASQTAVNPYTYEGTFGYFEADSETYPDIKDCDDNLIWGNDSDDNPITTSTRVRLFKFPDRRLVPHIGNYAEWITPFGIKFDNITYPDSTVIGHRFLFAERTEFDKTVVDSGWAVTPRYEQRFTSEYWIRMGLTRVGLFGALDTPDPFRHQYYDPSTPQSHHIRYISGKMFYDNSLTSFNYYKTNQVIRFGTGLISTSGDAAYANTPLDTGGTLYSIIRNMDHTADSIPSRTNHNEQQTFLVKSKGTIPAQGLLPPIVSDDLYTGDSVSYIGYGLEDTTPLLGTQIIDTIHNGTDTQFEVHNFYTYKKTSISPYSNFITRQFKPINHNYISSLDTNDNIFYGGDTLISENNHFRLAAFYRQGQNQKNYAFAPQFYHHFEEREMNTPLRNYGTENFSKYFRDYNLDGDLYNYNKVSYLNTVGNRVLEDVGAFKLSQTFTFSNINEEFYSMNPDYNLRIYDKAKTALPLQFNYCSICSGIFPNRIVFSPKSFDEEVFDMYRTNLVNDYVDIPAHRGQITGLSYRNNQLLVHTEDTTFILQPNPQQIATDQNTAYLTTGDFLSIPPQELIQTDVGMGGLQNKQSACNTPMGRCWADEKRGEILMWDGQVEMLSNKGLSQWLKESLPSELNAEYFRVLGEDFPVKSTLNTVGIGVILYYDPRFKRLLVTKKDYLPLDLRANYDQGDVDHTVYAGIEGWKTKPNINVVSVVPTDPDYFENKSWTLSYSFLDQSWTSWHSYIPWHSFADSNSFYTTTSNNDIWKHLSKNNYQKYFNTKYDFVIEWQNFDPVSTDVSSLYYVGYSHIWDDTNKQFKTVDTTFDKLVMYNFEQSSGLQSLTLLNQQTNPYGNVSLAGNSKFVIRTDQNYKIAGIYDMAEDYPVTTKDWSLVQLYPGYIDQVPNTAVIDFTKSQYDWGNLWDKFVFVRLFYKPSQDHRKSVILQVLNSQQSIR